MESFAPYMIKIGGNKYYFDMCNQSKDVVMWHKENRKKNGWLVRVKPFGGTHARPFAWCLYTRRKK